MADTLEMGANLANVETGDEDGLTGEQILGIILGCVGGFLVLCLVLAFVGRNFRKAHQDGKAILAQQSLEETASAPAPAVKQVKVAVRKPPPKAANLSWNEDVSSNA